VCTHKSVPNLHFTIAKCTAVELQCIIISSITIHYGSGTMDAEMRQCSQRCCHHCFWHATQDSVAPYVDSIFHRGQFWAMSTASGSDVSDHVGQYSAMWCGDILVVFSNPPERRQTGFSWHLHCFPRAQCAQTE